MIFKVGLDVLFRGEVKPMDITVTEDQNYWLSTGLALRQPGPAEIWFRKRKDKYGALVTEKTARMNWRHTYQVFDCEDKRRVYKHFWQIYLEKGQKEPEVMQHWFDPENTNVDEIEKTWRDLK